MLDAPQSTPLLPPGGVVWEAGGEYSGSLTAAAAGNYSASLVTLGSAVSGMSQDTVVLSFNLSVLPAAVDPMTSFVIGGGLTTATVEQPATFMVGFFKTPRSHPLVTAEGGGHFGVASFLVATSLAGSLLTTKRALRCSRKGFATHFARNQLMSSLFCGVSRDTVECST